MGKYGSFGVEVGIVISVGVMIVGASIIGVDVSSLRISICTTGGTHGEEGLGTA